MYETLKFEKFKSADFKCGNSFFSNSCLIYSNSKNFGSKLNFFGFTWILFHFDKFESACLKRDKFTLKSCLKMPQWSIFSPKFQVFQFWMKFCIVGNLKVLISNMTLTFYDCCPKHPNKANLVPILRVFNFPFWKIGGCLKCDNSVFVECYPKNTQIRQF